MLGPLTDIIFDSLEFKLPSFVCGTPPAQLLSPGHAGGVCMRHALGRPNGLDECVGPACRHRPCSTRWSSARSSSAWAAECVPSSAGQPPSRHMCAPSLAASPPCSLIPCPQVTRTHVQGSHRHAPRCSSSSVVAACWFACYAIKMYVGCCVMLGPWILKSNLPWLWYEPTEQLRMLNTFGSPTHAVYAHKIGRPTEESQPLRR